jgi:hypothetical protein
MIGLYCPSTADSQSNHPIQDHAAERSEVVSAYITQYKAMPVDIA